MISHPHQCIFVHIPKTAGNSINRVFGVGWEDHKDLQRYFSEVPHELFDSYFKFAVVRNPWDRLLSDYNYQRKKSREKDSKLFVFTERGLKRNFAEWVEVALSQPDYYEPQRWGGAVSPTIHRWSPQIDWISVDGAPRLDFVARLEHLPEDFRAISRRLELPASRLPHRNRRFHWHYSHYYDRATRDLVGAYYARDIEYFRYDFEEPILHFRLVRPSRPHADAELPAPTTPDTSSAPSRFKRRPPAARSWRQRSHAVVVASVAMFIGAWTAPLTLKPSDHGGPHSLVGAVMQESFGRVVSGYPSAPLPRQARGRPGGPLAEFRRLTRSTPGMELRVEFLAPAGLALMPMVEVAAPPARLPSASWPVTSPDDRVRPRFTAWFSRQGQDG